MNKKVKNSKGMDQSMQAEFDLLADEYHEQHKANVAISGESPKYFAEYKIADLASLVSKEGLLDKNILDFGCGIGNSIPFFRKYFGQSEMHCCDVSARSIEIAQTRFPGNEKYLRIGTEIPAPSQSQDIVFAACVFHHIPFEQHQHWLAELRRVTKPGGLLVIFEHNPLNPLTLHAVNTCPFDVNARLIRAGMMNKRLIEAGWKNTCIDYRLFFSSRLKALRIFEQHLGWLALGAQYRIIAYVQT